MHQSSRPFRTPFTFSESLNRQLGLYALAAGAAGVGMLALTSSAEAKIVYTPAHVPILGPRGFLHLDINHDGVADFVISNTTNYNTDQAFWDLFVQGRQGNAVIGTFVYRGFPPNARAITQGGRVGSGAHFFQGAAKLATFYDGGGGYSAHGNWVNVTDRYLGLKFQIKGETHYGWARLSVQVKTGPVRIIALLTGYAYETVPNQAIPAGKENDADNITSVATPNPSVLKKATLEPVTLAFLALGSRGLSARRREDALRSAS